MARRKKIVNPYGDMSDNEIDEHFRMGWIAFNDQHEYDEQMSYAWREGWLKSQKSAIQLIKEKHDAQKAATSRNNRI